VAPGTRSGEVARSPTSNCCAAATAAGEAVTGVAAATEEEAGATGVDAVGVPALAAAGGDDDVGGEDEVGSVVDKAAIADDGEAPAVDIARAATAAESEGSVEATEPATLLDEPSERVAGKVADRGRDPAIALPEAVGSDAPAAGVEVEATE